MKNISTLIAGFSVIVLTLLSAALGYADPCVGGTPQYSVLTEDRGSVLSLAFNPHHTQSDILAVGWSDGTIQLWNAKARTLLQTLTGHTGIIFTLAFSPNGNILASGSADGTVRLWNTTDVKNQRSIVERQAPFTGHTDFVLGLAFSADGKTLASGGKDGSIWLWNLETGQRRNVFPGGTLPAVLSLAFSPVEGPPILATARADNVIRVWNLGTSTLMHTFRDHTDLVVSLAFSTDGSLLASGSADSTVRLWDTDTGDDLEVLTAHTDWVNSVAFNKTILASAGFDNAIFLWEAGTKNLLHTLTAHSNSVESVAFNRDGNILASGGANGRVLLWNITPPSLESKDPGNTLAKATPFCIDEIRTGMINPIGDVDYFRLELNGPGKLDLYTAAGGLNTVVELRDSTGSLLKRNFRGLITLFGFTRRISHDISTAGTYYFGVKALQSTRTGMYRVRANFTPGSKDHGDTRAEATLLPVGESLTGKIDPSSDVDYFKVNITEPGLLTLYTEGNLDTIGKLIDKNGNHLITNNDDGNKTNFLIYADVPKGTYYVEVTEFNGDAIGAYEIFADFTELPETAVSPPIDFEYVTSEPVQCIAYGPKGDVLAAGDNANNLYLLEVATGKHLHTFTDKNNDPKHGDVYSVAFSNDNRWLAIGGQGGHIRVWKRPVNKTWADAAKTNAFQTPEVIRVGRTIWSVAFSRDSTRLACAKSSPNRFKKDTVDVWQLDSALDEQWDDRDDDRDKVTLEEHNKNVKSVVFDPTINDVLYSGGDDGRLLLWQLNGTGSPANFEIGKHTQGKIECIAISSEGVIASGDSDGDIVLWKQGFAKQPLKRIHKGAVKSLAFHPSGNVLVSGGDDGKIHLWDVKNEIYIDGLQLAEGNKINSITFNAEGDAIAIGTDKKGSDLDKVYQFALTSITGFANRGNFSLDFPLELISEEAHGKDATYFVLDLQFPRLINGSVKNPIYEDCIITLDLPGVQQAPVSDPDGEDERLDKPLYFMYPLQTPQQRLNAVENPPGETRPDVIKSAIGSGIGATIGFTIGLFLPGGGQLFGAGIRAFGSQASARVFGSTAGTLIGIGLKKLGPKDPSAEEMILAETADPFFLMQKDTDKPELLNLEAGTNRPLIAYSVLFLIEKEIKEINIIVEQAYRLKADGPLYVAKYARAWDLRRGTWGAPGAQSMSLADYPPFQKLPPEEQAYLLRYFGSAVNVNAEHSQIPTETSLLPNYPNPFNPETWLPYQLAKPADVTLTIYDIKGHVVRDLNLGHQRPGVYHSRSRAAHWDGRNAHGELVASGVYFYTLKADDFSATKRMLIRK